MSVSPVNKLYLTPVKTTFRVWCLYHYLVYALHNAYNGFQGGIEFILISIAIYFTYVWCELFLLQEGFWDSGEESGSWAPFS